jgi:ATP-dependent protease ClpP protease subunit
MLSQSANRLIWAAMLALLAVLVLKTRDNLDVFFDSVGKLEVRKDADAQTVYLRWRGKIDAPMESRINDAFEIQKANARRFVLVLSSPGGSLDHGAKVIRVLRKIEETHNVETVVEAGRTCASMCVPVYLSGQRRTAAETAKFMFHEVSFREYLAKEESDVPDTAKASETDRFFRDYFLPAGVPESWVQKVRADMAGHNDVWKTGRELMDESAGIVQQVRE